MIRLRGIFRILGWVVLLLSDVSLASEGTRLSLAEAITLAMENNENVLLARERIEQAENARMRARAAFIPMLTAGGTYTRSDKEIGFNGRIIQRRDAFAGAASLVVTLFRGPLFPALKQAEYHAASARAQAAWDRNLIAFETAEAYFSMLAADEMVAAAERTRETTRSLLLAVEARREAGEALGVDQTRAELEVVKAEEALVRARNASDSAVDYLGFLINKSPPFELEAVKVHAMPKRPGDALIHDAWQRRPDLLATTHDVAAADKDVQGAWMDYLPSLSAAGNYRLSQNTGWSGDIDSWNIVVSLDWILFDGGVRRAERLDRESRRRMSRLKARLKKREIGQEVRQALRDLTTADATLKTAREKERLARMNHEAVYDRYRAGLATSLEVVQADDDLVQSETGAILEALNLSLRRLSLLKSLGLNPLGKELVP